MGLFRPLNPPIRDWRDRHVWIVGASSGIGAALARSLLAAGASVALTARREAPLASIAAEARPGTPALVVPADVCDADAVARAHTAILRSWPRIDLTIWVAGTYQPMHPDDYDLTKAREILETNLSVFNGLATLLPSMRASGAGSLAIVSSVSGYRGLPRTTIAYGPSKAALISLAETLYLDLHARGHGIYLIDPGFVGTRLTALNDFPMPGLLSPEEAATRIMAGFARGAFEIHFPLRLTAVLKLARILPYRWYFALVGRMTDSGRPPDEESGR